MRDSRQESAGWNHFYTALLPLMMGVAGLLAAHFFHTVPSGPAGPEAVSTADEIGTDRNDTFRLPETVTLCGQPVPIHDHRVWEMLDREFQITVWDRAQVIMYLKRAARYFPMIERKLTEAGLPDDLKYLAVAESALIRYSRSHKGARGPWQFMVTAARSNGLRRDAVVDERLSFSLSTEAALRNLKRLYRKFGSWPLAMAAYNGGETRLRRAIREQGTTGYYRLNLPIETERYVYRIAAIKIVMENPRRYGIAVAPDQLYRPLRYDEIEMRVIRSVQIADLAQAIGTDYKDLKERNLHFLRQYIPPGTHRLQIPPGSGFRTLAHLNNLNPRVRAARITVSDRPPMQAPH